MKRSCYRPAMLPILALKHCGRCDQIKTVDDFYVTKVRYDGLSAYCAECHRAWNAERVQRAKERALVALGGRCMRCHYEDRDALQIDHVNGGGNRARRENGDRGAGFFNRIAKNPDP